MAEGEGKWFNFILAKSSSDRACTFECKTVSGTEGLIEKTDNTLQSSPYVLWHKVGTPPCNMVTANWADLTVNKLDKPPPLLQSSLPIKSDQSISVPCSLADIERRQGRICEVRWWLNTWVRLSPPTRAYCPPPIIMRCLWSPAWLFGVPVFSFREFQWNLNVNCFLQFASRGVLISIRSPVLTYSGPDRLSTHTPRDNSVK